MGYIGDLRVMVGHRPLITACAGALILDEEGRLLRQQRRDNGCWGIPGGRAVAELPVELNPADRPIIGQFAGSRTEDAARTGPAAARLPAGA